MELLSDKIRKSRYISLKESLSDNIFNVLKQEDGNLKEYLQYNTLVDYIKNKNIEELSKVTSSIRNALYKSNLGVYGESVASFICSIEEMWSYEHNIHFFVDVTDKSIEKQKPLWLNSIDSLMGKDVILDIKYKQYNYTVSFMQLAYNHICDNGEIVKGFVINVNGFYGNLNGNISNYRNLDTYGAEGSIHADYIVFPQVSDRYYNNMSNVSCYKCNSRCVVSKKIKVNGNEDTGITTLGDYDGVFIISKSKLSNGVCPLMSMRGLSVEEVRDILYYCLNTFCLKKVQRDSTLERGNKPKIQVSTKSLGTTKDEVNKTLKRDYSSNRFISIQDGIRLERKRESSKHSFHNSPREHVRRPTLRKLKSGKVVPVRGSIVNAGYKSGDDDIVYKVNIKE